MMSSGRSTALAEHVHQIERLSRVARAAGIRLGPGNRVELYERIFKRFAASSESSRWAPMGNEGPSLLNALREVNSMTFILDHLGSDSKWLPRLSSFFEGQEHACDDRNHSPRSFQSELYVAAQMKSMGLVVEPARDPDILATWNGWRFGVAVKRLRSDQKYRKRFDEGFAQITKSKFPGLVAFDITPLISMGKKPMLIARPEHIVQYTQFMLNGFVRSKHPGPMGLTKSDLLFGGIFFATTSAVLMPDCISQHCTGMLFTAMCELDDPRGRRAVGLHDLFTRREVRAGHTVTRPKR